MPQLTKSAKKNPNVKRENLPVFLGEYSLLNAEKYNRVINGVLGREGQLVQKTNRKGNIVVLGLGLEADPAMVLACYDRLGGAIKHNGKKLEHGCFWDFVKDRPREKLVLEEAEEPNQEGAKATVDDEVADKGTKKREALNASAGAVELAEQHGITLSEVKGSGAGGRILKADIEALVNSE